MNELSIYFDVEWLGFTLEATILIAKFLSPFDKRPIRRNFSTVRDGIRGHGNTILVIGSIFKLTEQNILIFLITFFKFNNLLIQPYLNTLQLEIILFLFLKFFLHLLHFPTQLILFFLKTFNFTNPFFLCLKEINMSNNFLINLFKHSISFFMF